MTQEELIQRVTEEVKGLSNYLEVVDFENACSDAIMETGWSFPVSINFQIFWLKERVKRHLFFYLLSESAHKFKVEQLNLQHRFEHYSKLIADMDDKFVKAIEDNPTQFANASIFEMFGVKIDAGFSYDPLTGKDQTYKSSNYVGLHPAEED